MQAMHNVWHPQVHPDVRTTTGITMMMLASYGGHTEACQVLIDRRALTGLLKNLVRGITGWPLIPLKAGARALVALYRLYVHL